MTEKEAIAIGIQTVIDEFKKLSVNNEFMNGLVTGLELGMRLGAVSGRPVEVHPVEPTPSEPTPSPTAAPIEEEQQAAPLFKKFTKTHRSYTNEQKKDIVKFFFEHGCDQKLAMEKFNVLGQGSIRKWAEEFAEELGYQDLLKDYLQQITKKK